MKCEWFKKDPDNTEQYYIDFSDWLNGQSIASSTWTVSAGLTVVSSAFLNGVAKITVSGGTLGTVYSMVCRVVAAAGDVGERSEDREIFIAIESK
jgi:hypothetical protein